MKNSLFKILILSLSVLFAFILVLLLFYNFSSLRTKSGSLVTEIGARLARLEKVRSIQDITKDLADISQNLKKIDIFVNPDQELNFITDVERLVTQNLLSHQLRLDVRNKKSAPFGGQTIPTTITVKGQYLNSLQFLVDLERLNHQVTINSIRILNLNSETEKLGVEMTLFAETYSYPEIEK